MGAQTDLIVTVHHAPSMNGPGRIEGSAQQLLGENVTFNGGFTFTGDLLVPGTPTLQINGNPTFAGILVGTGSASPTGHKVTLNGNVSLGFLRPRTDPVALPTVPPPPAPSGTRSVTISATGQSIGNPATLRNLTLNGNVGQVAVPPGTYGDFSANGGSGFTFGVAGATTPAVYNLQHLTFNGNAKLVVLGRILMTVANGFTANSILGATNQSSWLQLELAGGGLTLNGGSFVHANVTAPAGSVIVNGNSCLIGSVKSDRLTINGNGCVKAGAGAANGPPVANAQSVTTAEDTVKSLVLSGSDPEGATLTYTVLANPTRGSLSGTTPNLVYTPALNENGSDSFIFKVNDGAQDSAAATVSITITPVNDAPVAQAQSLSTAENTPAPVTLLGSDVEASALTYTVVTQPQHGILLNAAPDLIYEPDPNYSGPDSFTFRVNDGQLDSAPATVSITVIALDARPVAEAQSLSTYEDTALAVTLTGTDIENDPLTFTVLTPPGHGTLSGIAPNLSYLPANNYHGADSFTFRVSDQSMSSTPATISLTILPVNDRPIAYPTNYATLEDTSINVVISASDIEDKELTYTVVTLPAHGSVTGTGTNLVYSPAADYNGADSFDFKASDGAIDSATVSVSLTISAVNDTPIADARTATTEEDTPAPIALTGADVDGDALTFTIVTEPAHGVLTLSSQLPNSQLAVYTYAPNDDYHGADSFTYIASDAVTNSETATVTITIRPVNDAPVADAQSLLTDEDTPLALTLTGTDIENGALTFTVISSPVFGTLSGTVPNLTYTPDSDFYSTDSFIYIANDGQLGSAPATVIIDVLPVNDAPAAVPQSVSTPEDIPADILLAGTDVDGDPLNFIILTPPIHGTLTLNPQLPDSQPIVYTPAPNYHGPDSFIFAVNDGPETSPPALVSITVEAVNDSPAVNAGADQTNRQDRVTHLQAIISDDGDPLGGLLTIQWSGQGPGNVFFADRNAMNTSATFSAPGVYVLTATVSDGLAASQDQVVITVTPPNTAPMVHPGQGQLVYLPSGATLNGAVQDDGIPAGAIITKSWRFVSGPGTVTFGNASATNTSVTFGTAGNYVLRLTADDGELTNSAQITFALRNPAVNAAPLVNAGRDKTIGLTNVVTLCGSVSDDSLPQGAPLSISWTVISGPGTVTFDNASLTNSRVSFSALGSYVLQLTASDTALSASDDVSITVYPVNNPPVVNAGVDQTILVPDPALLSEDGSVSLKPQVELSVSLSSLARWNNTIGQPGFTGVPSGAGGVRGSINGLALSGTNLFASGLFKNAGGQLVKGIARWDGAQWFPLYDPRPNSLTNPAAPPIGFAADFTEWVGPIAARGNDVFASGGFLDNFPDSVDASLDTTARWDGQRWLAWEYAEHPLTLFADVLDIAAGPQDVYVVGWFSMKPDLPPGTTNVSHHIARWNGTNWLGVGEQGVTDVRGYSFAAPRAVAVGKSGEVYVGGEFFMATPSGIASNVVKWDGTNWSPLGLGVSGCSRFACRPVIHAMTVADDDSLYVVGDFGFAGGLPANDVARWDGTNWSAFAGSTGNGVDNEATAVAVRGRDVYVGGTFNTAGGFASRSIARWNGQFWSPLGPGPTNGVLGSVLALAVDDTGVYVSGDLSNAGGLAAAEIAKWEFQKPPPTGADLTGAATDDGLPMDAGLSFLWSKVSGPGTVTFANATNALTTARFSAAGTYVLRLTASDSDLTGFDELTIEVIANKAPVVTANAPGTVGINESFPLQGAVSDDGLPANASVVYAWSVISTPVNAVVTFQNPAATNTSVRLDRTGVYVLRLTANDSHFSSYADVIVTVQGANLAPAPNLFSYTSSVTLPNAGYVQADASDDGRPVGVTNILWSVVSGPAPVAFSNATAVGTPVYFTTAGSYRLRLTVSDTELTANTDFNITVSGATQPPFTGNLAPAVNAGPDLTVIARRPFALGGSASDDGLPAGSALFVSWSASNNVDRVYFDEARQPVTTAIINTPGAYLLRLTATDGQFSVTDEAIVTVVAATNEPPAVIAGPDLEVTRPQPAQLFGAVVDDGLPLAIPLIGSWTKVSGPGNVIFDLTATNLLPLLGERAGVRADFTSAGTYLLRLTYSDSVFTRTDDVTITVNEGTNAPPLLNAGPDFAVALPNFAVLSTTATDDGLPSGTLEVTWSQMSGPGNATFTTFNGTWLASFNATGTYVLRLAATDGLLTTTDGVTVTAYNAPNAPTIAILSPIDAAILTAPTAVTGTVQSVVLQSWTLQYRLKPADSEPETPNSELETWTALASGSTEVSSGPLATFDPTLLLNGIYELQLTATDIVGRTSTTDPVTLVVDRNMKVGHFTLSFNDLTIPVAGIPIQVTRTYDSRDKRVGDFGVGWTLDLKNIRLQKNRHLGRAWDQTTTGGLFPSYCIDTLKPRVVTITFPDGTVQKFELALAPSCQALAPLIYPDAVFAPIGGNTFGTLTPLFEFNGEIVTDEQLVWGGEVPGRADFISYERLLNPPPGPADNLLFNPDLFEFTSQEGYRYILSETNGLRSVTDPNGNTLTITSNDITWANSLSASGGEGEGEVVVSFQRDDLGRITNIVDALGLAMTYRYDTNGNLTTFTDRDGNTNRFTYDGRHSLLTLSDGRDAQTISNDYDAEGRLLSNTDALGNSVGYSYDLNSQRTFTTNRLGFVTVNEFDSHGNVIRTINPLGAFSSFVYDANDNLLVKSNANGCACAMSYTYDAFDNRISETDARGNTTAYTYDGQRKVLTMTEPSGFGTTNTYDSSGNLLSTIDSAGQVATFTYNNSGKVTRLTDPKGHLTQFAYNEAGFLTNEVNALGHVTEYEVDANGNRLSQAVTWSQVLAIEVAQAHLRSQGWMEASTVPTPVTVVAGTNIARLVMRHEYTASGLPLRTLYYDGSSTSVRYNEAGKKEQTTDQLGRTTSHQYDDQGRVESITYPNGCQELFQYDAEGQLILSTDRRGFQTHYTYDATGKLINTRFADDSQISATYFADGSLRTETAKNGEITQYEIDADGNRTSVSNSVGVTRYSYNYKKFAASKIDPLGRTNLYDYDVLGRNTLIIYPNNTTKSATFYGKLVTSETDQNGRTTGYGYDALGRLIAVTNAAGEVTGFTYDELGNKTSETDPLGRTTFFEYDLMRRLTRTVYPDAASVSTKYDVSGRAVARTDQDGNLTRFGYDEVDNVSAVTNALGGVTGFTYDCGGNKLSQADPDGRTTHFEYDSLSRLTRVSHSCGTSETTAYDIAGRAVAKTDANGQTTQFGYDLRNNLVTVIDPLNRTNSFTYDAAGNRLSETDASGQITAFTYDNVERRTGTTHPDGTTEHFSYDGTGRFLSHTDQQGKVSTFENDPVGRLIAVTDPLGRVTRYGYDANGNRTAETNANNLATRHEYDELGRRTRTIYPDASAMIMAYDRLGRRVSETDAAGHTTLFAFDELSRLTGRQDHLGNITRFGYDAVGRLASQTDANNQTTTFEYDCLGRRNRIINPDGTAQSGVFDSVGRRLIETDANTNSTFFAYDAFGRLLATTNALGHVTQFGYDPLDRLVSRTDALGRTTTFEYDALGRRTRTVYPDGAAQTAGYDAKGRRTRETDPAGNSTFYVYDDNDRLVAVTNALNQVTLYQYDGTGRLIVETDALGRTTTFEYDALDRRTRTVSADGTARTTSYDVLGRRVSDTDQANVATTYGYDAIGRLTAVTNALGDPTFYGYDPVGRLVAQTNANSQATTFAYDSLGRRVRRTLPGGQTETYAYDPVGNIIARTNFNGRVINYAYDPLNRVTAKVPDATLLAAGSVPVTYAYNALGLRTNMTDAGGVTDYFYDVRDRLAAKSVHWTLLSIPTTLSYAYDTNGNLAAIRSSNPNGTEVTYTNDALNRLSVVHEGRLGPTTYSYDPVGNLQGFTRPNGVQSQMQYDSLYRLTNLGVTRASAPVADYEYTVGPTGHRLGAVETIRTNAQNFTIYRSWGYDTAYRLTTEVIQLGASATPGSLTYTYDAAGNRLSRLSTLNSILPSTSHSYDANNRLLSDRYDANGNTTNAFVTTPLTGQTNEVFDRFDFEDRLFERTTTLNPQPSTINIAYDGDGNRVAKTVATGTNTLTTLYVVDDRNPTGYAQVLEELTSANGEGFAVTRVYTWGHALLSQDQFAGGQWSAHFHGHDGQGSVRFLTDTSGVVTDTFDYDAFGNLIARSGSTPNNYLFRGEQYDPDLNLYYLRARYANPATGRFWTADSFEGFATDPASLHPYTFNQNDPVNRIDPSGHISLAETFSVAALAPIVRGAFLNLWDGVNNFSYGMSGGNALKFTSREEAYFIDSLAVGPGWKFGKPNFWATVRGAPFLLSLNPNIWQSAKPCAYECIPFDLDVPVYGPSAGHPIFELEADPVGTWLNTDHAAWWDEQTEPVRPGVYTDSFVENLVRNWDRDAQAYTRQLNHNFLHAVQDTARVAAHLGSAALTTDYIGTAQRAVSAVVSAVNNLPQTIEQLPETAFGALDRWSGQAGNLALQAAVAVNEVLDNPGPYARRLEQWTMVALDSPEKIGNFTFFVEALLASGGRSTAPAVNSALRAASRLPARALTKADVCLHGARNKMDDVLRRFPRLNPANYQYDFSLLNTGPGAFVPGYVSPAAKNLVRSSLPDIPKTFVREFEGAVQIRTLKAGDKLYRSPWVPDEVPENPGAWFGTRRTATQAGTDSMFQITKWGNPNTTLRTYELTHDVTVYYGKVKGGTGYQVLFPKDLTPGDILNFVGEAVLK